MVSLSLKSHSTWHGSETSPLDLGNMTTQVTVTETDIQTNNDYVHWPNILMDSLKAISLVLGSSHGFLLPNPFHSRYRHGRLLQMALQVSPTVKTLPPCISVPALRFGLADQKSENATRTASTTTSISADKDEESEKRKVKGEEEVTDLKVEELDSKIYRTYLFEEAMINSTDSKLWTNMQFWEDLFLDTVVQERGLLGPFRYAV